MVKYNEEMFKDDIITGLQLQLNTLQVESDTKIKDLESKLQSARSNSSRHLTINLRIAKENAKMKEYLNKMVNSNINDFAQRDYQNPYINMIDGLKLWARKALREDSNE